MKNGIEAGFNAGKALLVLAAWFFPTIAHCDSGSGLLSNWSDSKEKQMKEVAVQIAELPEQYKITPSALDFSPDGKLLAVRSAYQTINIWDWQSGHIVHTVEIAKGGNDNGTEPLRFSPDGRWLAVCHGRADGNVVIRIWRTATWGIAQDIVDSVPSFGCHAIGFSADGKWLMEALDRLPKFPQDALFVYDTATWQRVWALQIPHFHANALTISPDGKSAALGGELFDGSLIKPQIAIVDLEQRAIVRTIQDNGVMDPASRLAWSPDGKYLAGAGGQGLQIFEADSGRVVVDVKPKSITAHTSLRYTTDGMYLIEGLQFDRVPGWGKIWDGQHSELLQEIPGNVGSIAVSRDGRYMATGVNGKTIVWQFK